MQIIQAFSENMIRSEELHTYLEKLEQIYQDGFRHEYSQFYSVLSQILTNGENTESAREYLPNNLNALYKSVEKAYQKSPSQYQTLYSQVFKLKDHINLEISRINSIGIYENKIRDLERDLEKNKKDLDCAKNEVEQANDSLKESTNLARDAFLKAEKAISEAEKMTRQAETMTKKAEALQNEIITVLSIFSAVVLAFMGGMSFTSSTLESIASASVYKVALIALICGLVIFNTICCLIYLVAKITGKNILSRCDSPHCTCACEGGVIKPCPLHVRLRRRLPYVFWFNLIFLALMALLILAWFIGLHRIAGLIQSYFLHSIH